MLRNWSLIISSLLLAAGLSTALASTQRSSADSGPVFRKAKLYVQEGHKLKLKKVELRLTETALVIQGVADSYREQTTIPYSEIRSASYEHSQHHRWKTGILVSPLFLLSKAKKHWLTILHNPGQQEAEDNEFVPRLDKDNYSDVLAAIERLGGVSVELVPSRE